MPTKDELRYALRFSGDNLALWILVMAPKTYERTLRQLAKEYVKEGLFSKKSYCYHYDDREIRMIPARLFKNFYRRRR